jgi:hypothetical protein
MKKNLIAAAAAAVAPMCGSARAEGAGDLAYVNVQSLKDASSRNDLVI